MGIKGIYREIGPGERISLCKLAVQTLEHTGRPLRIAVDVSIWQFQIQAARGGANPAIRTLFYRLARLLSHSIEPIFVFDGPNKPAFKRNRRSTSRNGDSVSNAMARRLIRLFGFRTHDAPGEAEAECALLQRRGIVDAVLSEDVDTIMFGCTRTLRNWSPEGPRASKTPTHVSMYDTEALLSATGSAKLDREGMVLVALMSGGDYIPEGVPGCGVKVACEAARAGFGKSLCRLKVSESAALAEWRETLREELRDNKSGFFRTKHKALNIPDSFPSIEVLRYYTHPVVSQEATLIRVEQSFGTHTSVDVQGLRNFAAETLDWMGKAGAIKYIRVLAPGLLVQRLLESGMEEDSNLVQTISKTRSHFSTDATVELRVSYVPISVVKIDLDNEPDETPDEFGRDGLALNSDEEFDDLAGAANDPSSSKQGAGAPKKVFDPSQPELVWVPEMILARGVPEAVDVWNEKLEAKSAASRKKTAKATTTRKTKTTGMPAGAMDKFVKVTKKTSSSVDMSSKMGTPASVPSSEKPSNQEASRREESLPTSVPKRPIAPARKSTRQTTITNTRVTKMVSEVSSTTKENVPPSPRRATTSKSISVKGTTNPWTLASSQSTPNPKRSKPPAAAKALLQDPIHIASSSLAAPSPPAPVFKRPKTPPRTKHIRAETSRTNLKHARRSPLPENAHDADPFMSDEESQKTPQREVPSPRKQRSPRAAGGTAQSSVVGFSGTGKSDHHRHREASPIAAKFIHPPAIVLDLSDDEDEVMGKATPPSTTHSTHLPKAADTKPRGSNSPPEPETKKSNTTRLYVSRKSAIGFVKEVEVPREEVDRIVRDGKKSGQRMFRKSDISIIDLTE